MPELPFGPPKDVPRPARQPSRPPSTKRDAAYSHRDILSMYPSLRLDHLRYLEMWGW